MKKLILILMVLVCSSCNSQPDVTNIPEIEYGDCEPEVVPMGIYFENVIDLLHIKDEDVYLIEYEDTSIVDDEWDTLDYFQIEASKGNFFDFLEDYAVWLETKTQKDLNWGFIEIVTPVEGGLNYRYILVRLL